MKFEIVPGPRVNAHGDYVPQYWKDLTKLPNGRCGSKDKHEPHPHNSGTLGRFYCTAN
jgi:hypothetical protein